MFTRILRVQDVLRGTRGIFACGVMLFFYFPSSYAASSSQSFGTSIDFTMHRLATEYNDPSAQYLVGRNYLKGKSVEQNTKEAIKWFEMAAKQNHIRAQYQLGKIYLFGSGEVKPNSNYAFYFLSKAAEKNHLESQYELGNYYLVTTPEKPKFDKALRWFKEAAARDHVKSLYALGKMTYEGKGLDANPAEALRLLNLAAENGLLEATHYINQIEVNNPEHMALLNNSQAEESATNQSDRIGYAVVLSGSALPNSSNKDSAEYYRLGIQYLTGDKGEKQLEKSALYFQKAANQNHAKAQYQLAKLYKQGIGVEQSEQLYREWLEKAAGAGVQSAVREWENLQIHQPQAMLSKQQDPNELYILGLKYLTGNEVTKDPIKASQLFLDAAMQEHPRSQYQLGIMYIDGIGLSRDKDKAKQWLTKAAESGLVDARFVLNSLTPQEQPEINFTTLPVSVEPPETKEPVVDPLSNSTPSPNTSLVNSAENGNPDSQHELGMNYLKGKDGFDKDIEQAIYWLGKAAENGRADSQYQLGKLYKGGLGVDRNNSIAIMWFRKAANQGHREARKRLGGCRIC